MELQSLVGLLNHACKVVKPGRSFLRRMIALVHQGNHSIIRLNRDFRADLAWWREFVSQWNGVSFLHPPEHWPTVEIASDPSGSWGCGAWYNQSWFQLETQRPWISPARSLYPLSWLVLPGAMLGQVTA